MCIVAGVHCIYDLLSMWLTKWGHFAGRTELAVGVWGGHICVTVCVPCCGVEEVGGVFLVRWGVVVV